MWKKIEQEEDLFSRLISDLSSRDLKELCEGIDELFAAIWRPTTRESQESALENVCHISPLIVQLTYYARTFITLDQQPALLPLSTSYRNAKKD